MGCTFLPGNEGEREARGKTQECQTFEESTAVTPDCVAGGTALNSAHLCSAFILLHPGKSSFGMQNKGEKISRNKYLIVALINILSKRSHQSCNCILERGEILCGTEWDGEVKYSGRQPCGWHRKLPAACCETGIKHTLLWVFCLLFLMKNNTTKMPAKICVQPFYHKWFSAVSCVIMAG